MAASSSPRKSAPRKAAPKKAPASASVAARKEVRDEAGKVKPFTVMFRGEKFDIPVDRLGSARVQLAFKSRDAAQIIVQLLPSVMDQNRLIYLCEQDEALEIVSAEFLNQLNKVLNSPNS